MSVLIKGMEMPEKCANCPICVAMPLGDYVVYHKCTLLNLLASKRRRRNDCPLIPIPPHGRLKDADAFDSIKYEIPTTLPQRYEQGFHDGVNYVQHLIIDAPTVIEAEA